MQNTSVLQVQSTTWHRDSHDLFDYETPHVNVKKFLLSRPGKLFRTGAEVSCIAEGDTFPQEADYLLSIKNYRDGKFLVAPAERNHGRQLNPKKLWMIVRDMPNNKYILQENDVIKLGRFKLRVKQLVKNGESVPELKLDDSEFPVRVSSSHEMHSVQCRICLFEGDQPDDPLVCPCQCKGSIQYVHVRCIGKWISNRLNISDDPKSSFFFKQIQCELCKAAFPSAMILNDERIQIVKVPNTTPPFIVLENLNSSRGVHVISMAEKKDLKLGRGHESDVRIPDVSISRYHATIRFLNDSFQLEDHNSKFGTLVALRKAHIIDQLETVAVQVGRSVVNFRIDETAKPTTEIIDASADLVDMNDAQGRSNDNSASQSGGIADNSASASSDNVGGTSGNTVGGVGGMSACAFSDDSISSLLKSVFHKNEKQTNTTNVYNTNYNINYNSFCNFSSSHTNCNNSNNLYFYQSGRHETLNQPADAFEVLSSTSPFSFSPIVCINNNEECNSLLSHNDFENIAYDDLTFVQTQANNNNYFDVSNNKATNIRNSICAQTVRKNSTNINNTNNSLLLTEEKCKNDGIVNSSLLSSNSQKFECLSSSSQKDFSNNYNNSCFCSTTSTNNFSEYFIHNKNTNVNLGITNSSEDVKNYSIEEISRINKSNHMNAINNCSSYLSDSILCTTSNTPFLSVTTTDSITNATFPFFNEICVPEHKYNTAL